MGGAIRTPGVIFAWLILAHDAPAQLAALIDRLATADDFVVLHIDRRSTLWTTAVGSLSARFGDRLLVVRSPVAVRWGHHSQLTATRRLIEAALTRPFDVAHLVSGRDWPVASRAAIVAGIVATPGTCFIDTARTEQQERMQHWWFHAHLLNPRIAGGPAYRATKKLLRIASRTVTRVVPRGRSYGAPWHKGAQWWSLPRETCTEVAGELRRLRGRIRFTACSDEHVIQTLVARRHPDRIADPRRYTDWSTGESSPKTLTAADIPAIDASGAWIARKVDATVDDWFLTYAPVI